MTLRLAYRITAGLAVVLALMLAAPSSTPAAGGGQFCGGIFGVALCRRATPNSAYAGPRGGYN